MSKITAGQTMYENKGGPKERVVTKVGVKYFYVDNGPEGFDKNTLRYTTGTYSKNSRILYFSASEVNEIRERSENTDTLQRYSGWQNVKNLSNDQLRRIAAILNEPK